MQNEHKNGNPIKPNDKSVFEKSEFIKETTKELGGGLLAQIEATTLYFYYEKWKSASSESRELERKAFYLALNQSLNRMVLRKQIKG